MSYVESLNLREANRLDAALVVAVKSAWGRSKIDYHVSRDISENGVFVLDKHPPELGADLKMEFSQPRQGLHATRHGEMFYGWVEGHVVRVEDLGYAVKFEEEYHLSAPQWSLGSVSH